MGASTVEAPITTMPYNTTTKLQRISQGLCSACYKNPARLNFKLCIICRDKSKSRRSQLKAEGLCTTCRKPAVIGMSSCSECSQKDRENSRRLQQAIKLQVIEHYGKICACCEESNIVFLTVDHINGGGKSDRETIGAGDRFYRWIIKNNYPLGFRILCFNCNSGRSVNGGICPHQEAKANI